MKKEIEVRKENYEISKKINKIFKELKEKKKEKNNIQNKEQ